MANQIRLVMTAQKNTAPYQTVTWTVYNQPDNTGAQSGYPIGSLTNIQVDYIIDPSQTINPISLVVGGDLSGSLPNPNVVKLQGTAISSTAPATSDLLQYNGTSWTPTAPAALPAAGGDLSGTLGNATVVGLRGRPLSSNVPSTNDLLQWNGTSWLPVALPAAGGDLSGTLAAATVVGLRSRPLSSNVPTTGDLLQWNGTSWLPVSTVSVAPLAGAGLTLSSLTGYAVGQNADNSIVINANDIQLKAAYQTLLDNATSAATVSTLAKRSSNGQIILSDSDGGATTTYGRRITISETATFRMSQDARTTDAATNTLALIAQSPFASATGTNRKPADIDLTIGTPTNGGTTHGAFNFNIAGAVAMKVTEDSGSVMQVSFPSNDATITSTYNLTLTGENRMFLNSLQDDMVLTAPGISFIAGAFSFVGDNIYIGLGSGDAATAELTPSGTFDGLGANLIVAGQSMVGAGSTTGGGLLLRGGTGVKKGNIGLGGDPKDGVAGGDGATVIFIANATGIPSVNPAGGGVLYVESGALKYRGSSGTVTPIASA